MPTLKLLPLGCIVLLLACSGGGGSSNPPAPPVAVTVTPATATLGTTAACTAGNSRSFTATVANSGNGAVTWSVQEAGGGSVTSAGVYTAPTIPGTYHVVATAAADGSKAASATVTVMVPPAITTQPANLSVATGAPASFTVVASGGAPLAYQWSRNGQPVAGGTAATLTLASAQLADSGASFQCAVTNPVGLATSQSVLLSVASPVAITAFTAGQAQVDFGQSVQLAWSLTGTPLALALNGQNVLGQSGASVVPRNRQAYTLAATGANSDTRTLTVASRGIDLLGGGLPGYGNLDGTGEQARFNLPSGIVRGADQAFYVADQNNNVIRRIASDGTTTTLAGKTGNPNFQDGTGANAGFRAPMDLCLDGDGSLLVADGLNAKIRKVTLQGVVTTLATLPASVFGIARNPAGMLYVALADKTIRRVDPGTGTVTLVAGIPNVQGFQDGAAATFDFPMGLAVTSGPTGDRLFVAEAAIRTIRTIAPDGTVATLAGLAQASSALVDGVGTAARFRYPTRVVLDGSRLLVADEAAVRTLNPDTGAVGTLAKNLRSCAALCATDGSGCGAAGETEVYRVQADGTKVPLAGLVNNSGSQDGPLAQASFIQLSDGVFDAAGNLYVTQTSMGTIRKISPEGVVSTPVTGLFQPMGIDLDAQGRLVVVEFGKHRLVRIEANGQVTVLAGTGQAGFQDGPGASAQFSGPRGVRRMADGSLCVADYNNHRIRRVVPDGTVSTFAGSGVAGGVDGQGAAARFNAPFALAVDGQDNLYVGEFFNHAVRRITPAGQVSTFAGSMPLAGFQDGAAAAARFSTCLGLVPDGAGGLFVADWTNHAIRRVAADGSVSTLAGSPIVQGWRPGPLPGSLYMPQGLVRSAAGDLMLLTGYGLVQITAP